MPQYSPIAPVHILQQLHDRNKLGNYLLLLAHDVLEYPLQYSNLLFDVRSAHEADSTFIILDNGVIERGAPLRVDDLLEAASLVDPSCVVAPDVVGDFPATQKLIMTEGHLIARDYPIMFIPQGKTIDEIQNCIDWIAASFHGETLRQGFWGVPRWVTNKLGSRRKIIQYLTDSFSPCRIHLLGMSKNLRDDFTCLHSPYVMGIDSANPLVLGRAEIQMDHFMQYEHLEREDYWKCSRLIGDMEFNVEWMHEALSRI